MLDHILAVLLLIVIPVRALWRSRPGRSASGTKITRYIGTIGTVTGLLALLAINWLITGRSAQNLGLAAPTSTPSLIGLGIAVVVFIALFFGLRKKRKPSKREGIEAAQRDLFPATPKETTLFLVLSFAAGGGWEILYRELLLYYLPSTTGILPAVVIAALAYGTSHGFKSAGQFLGSIVSALAFTIAYVATINLWWLILIHIGLMLIGAAASKAISSNSFDGV